MSLLSTRHLSRHFGGLKAVEDVDFELPAGQVRALIGPNGAGKSTLMKVIAGECLADEGEILGQNLTITRLEQEVPTVSSGTVYDMVATGLGDIAPLLT